MVASLEDGLLVEDGVDGDGGLACLSITDDQLTLASANGHEGVDGLEASLHGLVHGLPGDDAWGLQLNSGAFVGLHGAFAVNGVTEGVDDSAEHALTDGHIDDGSRSLHDVAFLNFSIVTQDDNTDVVSLQVKSHALNSRLEFDHLTSLHLGETEDSGDTITNRDDGTEFFKIILLQNKSFISKM